MQMKTVVVDKIASITQACGLSHELRVATTDIPVRGRRGAGGRDPEQQVDLQPARADQRPHGQGHEGRRDRRRARPPPGAVRLLGPHARSRSSAGDIDPAAQHRRRARHLRLGEPRQGQAVRLRACSAACCSSRSSASASACRRGSATAGSTRRRRSTRTACRSSRSPAPAWKPARPPRPAPSSAACGTAAWPSHAFKATGVSLRRDILAMEDAGARRSLIFTDLGVVTTTAATGPALTRTMLTEMAAGQARRHRVRAGRRHPRRLRRRGDPAARGHRARR